MTRWPRRRPRSRSAATRTARSAHAIPRRSATRRWGSSPTTRHSAPALTEGRQLTERRPLIERAQPGSALRIGARPDRYRYNKRHRNVWPQSRSHPCCAPPSAVSAKSAPTSRTSARSFALSSRSTRRRRRSCSEPTASSTATSTCISTTRTFACLTASIPRSVPRIRWSSSPPWRAAYSGATRRRSETAIFCEVMSSNLRNKPCGGRYGDIIEAIGHTPLVELKRLSPKPGVRLWVKLESRNPTGSVKDRVARSLILDAEEKGLIRPNQTILEPTSGNTGISLAMICARKGYRLKVVMPDNVTPERTELLRMYGAEIVYSEGSKGSNGAVELALDMAAKDSSYYMPYQYGNQANPDAHYNGTALEILEELDEVSAFVAGLGTGGTLMGNGRRLKEELGDRIKIVAAEPMQGEPVQGLRSLDDGFIPPIIDLSLLDRKIFVTNRDAISWTRKLLDEEGLFAGVSSGAIARVALRIASELDEGNVVFIVADDGWKYLSSGIYTRPVEEIENLDSTVWW